MEILDGFDRLKDLFSDVEMTKERSILKMIIVNFFESIKPRNMWGNVVGQDYNGTQYYESPLSASSRKSRPSRWFVPKERNNFEQDIPPEWEAWLRYRRDQPPTEEEIRQNLEKMKETLAKAAELEKEYPKMEDKQIAGVTSKKFPVYGDLEGTPGGVIEGSRPRFK